VEEREKEMTIRFESVDELKRNTSPEFVAKNAAQLGIVATVEQVYGNQAAPKQNKYHVAPVPDRTYRGIVFSSKKEAAKCAEMDLCVQAGEIDFYLRQVPFIVGYDPLTKYVADFVTFKFVKDVFPYVWRIKVIETKGTYAPGAKRKLKLFREKYPNVTIEVC
jgi:hypothetical protein